MKSLSTSLSFVRRKAAKHPKKTLRVLSSLAKKVLNLQQNPKVLLNNHQKKFKQQ